MHYRDFSRRYSARGKYGLLFISLVLRTRVPLSPSPPGTSPINIKIFSLVNVRVVVGVASLVCV